MDPVQKSLEEEDETPPKSSMDEPVPVPERIELDPKGDLVLDVQKCYLLVSSRVLELFCQFFKTMLRSNAFMEGIEQPNVQHPPVKQVHEDHLDIFLLICRVLHYLPVRPPDCVEDYHLLADLCNFYGCSWALSFHVRAWMERWNFSNLPIDQLQTFLWVTFVFHLREKFQEVSLELAKAFTLQDWKAWDVHPMPLQLKDDMRELWDRVKNKIQQQIECAMDEVGENIERHFGTRDKFCQGCSLQKPSATQKCGNCGSRDFQDYLCTREIRLALFKDWLKFRGYWPLSQLNKQSSRSFLGDVPPIESRTICGLDDDCPLTEAKENLRTVLKATPTDIKCLKLEKYDTECLLRHRDEYTPQSPSQSILITRESLATN